MRKLEQAPKVEEDIKLANATIGISNSQMLYRVVTEKNETLKKIETEYYYWDKVKYQEKNSNEKLKLWTLVKSSRRLNYKTVPFTSIKFNLNLTNHLQQKLHEFDRNFGDVLGNTSLNAEQNKRQYLTNAIFEESITSSQIEGAVTTRLVAKDMLQKNRSPRNHSERMIVNNYQAIKYIVAHKKDKLTLENLLELHQTITAQTLDKPEDEGVLRTSDDVNVVNVIDGEIIHTPPQAAVLGEFITELCAFFNDEGDSFFIHPIVKASIVHFMIGYFHPFADGNGRTARALFYWYMLRQGYWLTEYLSISSIILNSREQYYRAFQYVETDDNDLTYFVSYQVKTLEKAYLAFVEYLKRIESEKRKLIDYQKDIAVNPRQAQILAWAQERPNVVFTVKEIERRLAVTNQTARTDLMGLVEKGLLEKIQANKKEQHFIFSQPLPS
jgi:Fic family protein